MEDEDLLVALTCSRLPFAFICSRLLSYGNLWWNTLYIRISMTRLQG